MNTLDLQKKDVCVILNVSLSTLNRIFVKLSIKPKYTKIDSAQYSYDQIYNLYITQNMSSKECSKYLGISENQFLNIKKHLSIKKPQYLKRIVIEKSIMDKYGVINYSQTEMGKLKHGMSARESSKTVQSKIKQMVKEKYGDIVYLNTLRDFCTHPLKKDFQGHYIERISEDILYKFYIQDNLRVKDCCKIFNVPQSAMIRFLKEFKLFKPKHLHYELLVKYSNAEKSQESAKNNGTYGKSNQENIIYNLLSSKYNIVKRQYKSDLYPFACDFYIPELDLYIEYNGYWTHGFEPYVGRQEQIEKVKSWESKNTPQYKKAIIDWTERDVLKRTTAKQNNLNYLEFFNMDEFNMWFYSLPG